MSRNYRDPNTGELIPTSGYPTNSANQITTFTSSDTTDANADSWTSVSPLVSGEQHKSIFAKISQMFKNVRYLYKLLGTTDISSIGNGTVTGAVSTLNNDLPKMLQITVTGDGTKTAATLLGELLTNLKTELGSDKYIINATLRLEDIIPNDKNFSARYPIMLTTNKSQDITVLYTATVSLATVGSGIYGTAWITIANNSSAALRFYDNSSGTDYKTSVVDSGKKMELTVVYCGA